jgi:hypothetical protein
MLRSVTGGLSFLARTERDVPQRNPPVIFLEMPSVREQSARPSLAYLHHVLGLYRPGREALSS